jgi:hypothetical protein
MKCLCITVLIPSLSAISELVIILRFLFGEVKFRYNRSRIFASFLTHCLLRSRVVTLSELILFNPAIPLISVAGGDTVLRLCKSA